MLSFSALAVLLYSAWALALLTCIVLLRVSLVASRKRAPDSFAVSGEDVSPFSGRLCRAHANCYENLPAAAGILMVAIVSGHSSATDPLALWFVAARICQSLAHLVSTGTAGVSIRFAFLVLQVVIQWIWIIKLAGEWL